MQTNTTQTEKSAVYVTLPKSSTDFFHDMEVYFQTRMKELEKFIDKSGELNEHELKNRLSLRLDAVRSIWLDLEGMKEIV